MEKKNSKNKVIVDNNLFKIYGKRQKYVRALVFDFNKHFTIWFGTIFFKNFLSMSTRHQDMTRKKNNVNRKLN